MAARPKTSPDAPRSKAPRLDPGHPRGAPRAPAAVLALLIAAPLALSLPPSSARAQSPGQSSGQRAPATSPSRAQADTALIAEALFRDAMALMDAKKYAEACPKLEESQRLAPGLGTRYHLGDCYEKSGRRAAAWSTFVDLAEAARGAGHADGAKRAAARAAALLPLPKLTIRVSERAADTPGIEISRNGVALGRAAWGTAIPVDPGEHVVRATAPGKAPWTSTLRVDAPSGAADISVPPLEDASGPGLGRRGAAILVGAAGAAGLIAGGVFGSVALSKAGDARAACVGVSGCRPTAFAAENGTYTFADLSTGFFVVGAAAVAAGAVLWLTAPPRENPSSAGVRVVPLVPGAGAPGAGALLEGSF